MPQLPPQERWWDGHVWSHHVRPATGALPAPGVPSAPGGGSGPRRGPVIAGVVGGAVLVGALVAGGVLLLNGSDGSGGPGKPAAKPAASASADSDKDSDKDGDNDGDNDGDGTPGGKPSPSPTKLTAVARDPVLGVGITVLDGWEPGSYSHASVGSKAEYACPVSHKRDCIRGGAVIRTATGGWGGEGALKKQAESRVAENAKDSYPKKSYGGITSHKVVRSGPVTVAGEPGYRVRWRVTNKLKPDAHVEAVVFRSPSSSSRTLALLSSVDIAKGAPPASDLDELRKGVVGGSGGDETRETS